MNNIKGTKGLTGFEKINHKLAVSNKQILYFRSQMSFIMNEGTHLIAKLFKKWSGNLPDRISPLPSSGSYRRYFRCTNEYVSAIGVYNEDLRENKAFLSFTSHFLSKGLNVPQIYCVSEDPRYYLLQDLGDTTLFNFIFSNKSDVREAPEVKTMYRKVLMGLINFQVYGREGLDYSMCYPRPNFDRQSMLWDLNYFKYHFLKMIQVLFDEQKLEDDFETLIQFLLEADTGYFMYRDFQSRNIMIHKGQPYFIDYQGGRRGALQYDLASILFESKTNLPASLRDQLLEDYISELSKKISLNKKIFLHYFYGYALIRIMQAMGAYGFRGLYEEKPLFIQSIPQGIHNLLFIYQKCREFIDLSELYKCFHQIFPRNDLLQVAGKDPNLLTVRLFSFSYKKQKPIDLTGNGGGFMFDCRGLPNPGRYSEYKMLTGRDQEVKLFLENNSEVRQFLKHVYAVIDQTVENYIERGFTDLMVSFGCTGGQHRSVYAVEQIKEHLDRKYDIKVQLKHLEL